jgi:N utilization substance protein A
LKLRGVDETLADQLLGKSIFSSAVLATKTIEDLTVLRAIDEKFAQALIDEAKINPFVPEETEDDSSDESEGAQEDSENVQEESDDVHEESDDVHDESENVQDESEDVQEEVENEQEAESEVKTVEEAVDEGGVEEVAVEVEEQHTDDSEES